jgi:hypothetical protein
MLKNNFFRTYNISLLKTINNKKNKLFFYFFIIVLFFLPVFSANHSLIHNLRDHNQYFSSGKKSKYFNITQHQDNHWHFCLLCNFSQQNEFTFSVYFLISLLTFVLVFLINKNHNFFFSFTCNILKTGPPCFL